MISIREMTRADIPEVAQLERQIFADPWSEKVYRETFELDGVGYIVVTDDDRIIGAAGVRNVIDTGEITNVMITPLYRRKGLAFKMLKELLELGRKLGARDFTLEVRAGNEAAIRLYESLGFVFEGIRPGFYRNPDEDARIYWMRSE